MGTPAVCGIRVIGRRRGNLDGGRVFQNKTCGFGEFRVFHRDGDFGETHGRALRGAVEDAVGHAFGTEGLVALLTEDPANGVYDIGLATAIGAHDAGGAGATEGDHGPLAKRLKANDFNFAQLEQGVPFCRELPLREALPHILRL